MKKVINDWELEINDETWQKVEQEYKDKEIAPSKDELFTIFELVKPQDVKVIFLGQDPYPKKGDAHGIAFSVKRNDKLPASLRNLYKELESDLGIIRKSGNLSNVANQGILFLNTVLTVEIGKPQSHRKIGWQETTNKVISGLAQDGNKVFVLLGNDAKKYSEIIDSSTNKIITASHPSPLSAYRGFFGSKIYSNINKELTKMGKEEIDWMK